MARLLSGVLPVVRERISRWRRRGLAVLALLAGTSVGATQPAAPTQAPEAVLRSHLEAVYARDYPGAYDWIAPEDRALKTREEYARENGTFTGVALEVSRALGALMRFEDVKTTIEGDRATVTLKAILPNANAPEVEGLLLDFDETRLAALTPADRQARLETLREMARAGRLPVVVGESERWELVRAEGSWRVALNWAGAVLVRFEAVTKEGLPWDFEPVRPVIRAKPGETLRTAYRVRNRADREITAKARHVLDPPEETGQLEIVACFCLLQQTLGPGESREVPVVFRVSYDLADTTKEMRVRYEYYPLEKFPEKTE
jgi:hypothetical protein